MAEPKFKHLEFLPIDEDNIVLNDNPESNIKGNSCLNLSFNALNSISRLSNIINVNKGSTSDDYNNFLDFSYVLEGALSTLLMLNSISNPQNTQITEHYRKYLINIAAGKILPSFSYCQNLLYTKFKTWGGLYGTVQYYINLREEYQEYYTPSEVAYYSALSLINYSRGIVYNSYLSNNNKDYLILNSLYTSLESSINDDSVEADSAIYNFAKNIIISVPGINNIYNDLVFYEQWLADVLTWGQSNRNLTLVGLPKTNEENARNTAIKALRVIKEYGLNVDVLKNISAQFMRQTLNPSLYEVFEKLTQIRKESTYIETNNPITSTEELIERFHNTIVLTKDSYSYLNANNLILSGICPPGGYSLLQLTLATCLLNRAYILSYRRIRSTTDMREDPNFRRSIQLIGYAGILLIKTGLPHIQSFALSLMRTFNVNITNIEPNNFLDIYT